MLLDKFLIILIFIKKNPDKILMFESVMVR